MRVYSQEATSNQSYRQNQLTDDETRNEARELVNGKKNMNIMEMNDQYIE